MSSDDAHRGARLLQRRGLKCWARSLPGSPYEWLIAIRHPTGALLKLNSMAELEHLLRTSGVRH
jgi:hypothetical protein